MSKKFIPLDPTKAEEIRDKVKMFYELDKNNGQRWLLEKANGDIILTFNELAESYINLHQRLTTAEQERDRYREVLKEIAESDSDNYATDYEFGYEQKKKAKQDLADSPKDDA